LIKYKELAIEPDRSSRIAIENANQGHFAVSAPNSPPPGTQILGTFASLLGLLGIFLYFTGWIYRWAYFGWFSLEINRLDLPLRSFLFVPIQVFCGDFGALMRTFLALVAVAFAIQFTLWILSPLPSYSIVSQSKRKFHQKFQFLGLLVRGIPEALRKDLIAVIWLLIILFWLARIQGLIDTRRDAVNDSSTLPVITLVLPEKQIAIGRNLEDVFTDPSLKGYRIIGETKLLEELRGKETNDSKVNPPRVWRLLIQNNNWTYVFRGLSPQSAENERPAILAIREDKEGQLMILAPDVPQSQ
jgi:hypothetical protein